MKNSFHLKTNLIDKLFKLIKNHKNITKDFLNDRNQPLPQKRKYFKDLKWELK